MNIHSQTITWFNSAPFHATNNVAMKNITRSFWPRHYNDVIMGTIASQITSLTIVYSIVYSDADQTKHQSSASLAFVRGIHRGPVNSPHKCQLRGKCFHLMKSSWISCVIKMFVQFYIQRFFIEGYVLTTLENTTYHGPVRHFLKRLENCNQITCK